MTMGDPLNDEEADRGWPFKSKTGRKTLLLMDNSSGYSFGIILKCKVQDVQDI